MCAAAVAEVGQLDFGQLEVGQLDFGQLAVVQLEQAEVEQSDEPVVAVEAVQLDASVDLVALQDELPAAVA